MKKILVVLFSVFCLGFASGSVLYVTGAVDFDAVIEALLSSDEADDICYIRVMDDFFIVDENGIVSEVSLNEPMDVPEVKDMLFTSLSKGKSVAAADEDTFEYVQNVCSLLNSYSVYISYITVNGSGEVTLYINDDLSIMLGDEEDTEAKIKDLRDLYNVLLDYKGVLYMQHADTAGTGYTFKVSSET